jgi:hypothetical protein
VTLNKVNIKNGSVFFHEIVRKNNLDFLNYTKQVRLIKAVSSHFYNAYLTVQMLFLGIKLQLYPTSHTECTDWLLHNKTYSLLRHVNVMWVLLG